MKKILLFCLFLLTATTVLTAQKFNIEKSDQFEDPEDTWNQLLQLKNGNTLFFHRKDDKGIEVTVYGKNRKKIAQALVESEDFDEDVVVRGVYEINGEAVIFFYRPCSEPILFRYRINAETGTLIQKDDLGHLKNLPSAAYRYKYVLNAGYSGIAVAKDPNSDCYATIFYDCDLGESKIFITVSHFDGSHKKINEARYTTLPGFKLVNYGNAIVDGNKSVYLLCFGFTKSIVKQCTLILSKLSVGETTFKHAKLNTDLTFEDVRSAMVFNHNSNKIQLMTVALSSSEKKIMSDKVTKYYLSLLSYIDPETLTITARKQIGGTKIADYAHAHIDKDFEFTGIPDRMLLNKDNTTTILLEEKTMSADTYLGAAGISELSDEGVELKGYAIGKLQSLSGGKRFMSFNYINTSKGHYVLFNDVADNIEKGEKATRLEAVSSGSGSSTVCYKLNDNSVDKSLLFDIADSDVSTFSYVGSADYNKDIETYATLIVEKKHKQSQARIAWVTFN